MSFSASDHRNATQVMRSDGQRHTIYAQIELPEAWKFFNWSNANAQAVLGMLGFSGDRLYGEATLAECRHAVMRARAQGFRAHTREEEVTYGAPRANADGTIELKPVRMLSFGLGEAGLIERVECFAQFVEVVAALGATHVSWD